ncbi:hypothetical protein K6745_18935 [Vibrio alginolyticus]|uniref:hypothetical protein n=1 Tax=Vibrio alginolyticus TaxID=663 RepID=UPI001EEE9420|nr:hypothetical protein [Vibrio alginolyticus]ULF71819.1 hypothetical protein K6745_18935 [Vibrio alginolyticus]
MMRYEINVAKASGKDWKGEKSLYRHYFRIEVPYENREEVYRQMQEHYPLPEYRLTLSEVRTVSTTIWQD